MKQVRLHGPRDVRLEEVARPTAGPNDVVVKVATAGICGSDLHFFAEGAVGRPTGKAVPIGHEFAGTLAEVGAQVSGLSPGQRVVVNPMSGGNRIGTGAEEEGGFAEYVLVRGATVGGSVFPIPDTLSFERAVLAEPIAVGMHGLNLAEATKGSRAVVFGAGPIGLGAVASLAHRGAAEIVVIDIVPERLERARGLGATAVINTRETDLRAGLLAALGSVPNAFGPDPLLDADVFIDAAGVGVLMATAVEMARPHARLVVIARHDKPLQMDLKLVMLKELTLRGSLCYPTEFKEVLDMLNTDRNLEPLVSHAYALDDVSAAFAKAGDAASAAKVLVRC